MPRLRIIVLEQEDARTFRYALWADVPAARQPFYASAGAVSVWRDALPADNANIANGIVAERSDKVTFPPGVTLAQAQAGLEAVWQSFQNTVTNKNPWVRYGSTWDGTTWTMTGVA